MKNSLTDRLFLTGPDLGWQGSVLAELHGGVCLVQLFSWLDGRPTVARLVRVQDMLEWTFYSDADEWRSAARSGANASDDRGDTSSEPPPVH